MGNQQGSFYKTIEEFPKYEINNLGHIRNKTTHRTKYTLVSKIGYELVCFKKGGKTFTRKVHRLVAEYFLEKPPFSVDNLVVKHLDNNKSNNVHTNLCWDSQYNNMQDAFRDGIIPAMKGEKNGRAVLTEDVVECMCRDFEKGMMPKEAVEKYGVSRQQAGKIRAGIQWKHIWCKYNIKVNRRKPLNGQSEGT